MTPTVLRIDASPMGDASSSRQVADRLVARLLAERLGARAIQRDLAAAPLPQIDAATIAAYFTAPEGLTPTQRDLLVLSDRLVDEIAAADAVVLSAPIYNFGVPASVKAWVDLIARAGRTFQYTENGPVGLLADRPVHLAMASGGTPVDGPADFATPWLRHVFGFVGLTDVTIWAADRQMIEGPAKVSRVIADVDAHFDGRAAA